MSGRPSRDARDPVRVDAGSFCTVSAIPERHMLDQPGLSYVIAADSERRCVALLEDRDASSSDPSTVWTIPAGSAYRSTG